MIPAGRPGQSTSHRGWVTRFGRVSTRVSGGDVAGERLISIGRGTRTSRFGVGKRESHDESAFYEQFADPVISDDEEIRRSAVTDRLFVGDARDMAAVASKSVALVGVRTQTAPSKRSGSAPRNPICSEPAMGWPPMNRG